jgi:hypothetical protein
MPSIVAIAVDAAAVARNRRRDTGMRTNMESLQFRKEEKMTANSHSFMTAIHRRAR